MSYSINLYFLNCNINSSSFVLIFPTQSICSLKTLSVVPERRPALPDERPGSGAEARDEEFASQEEAQARDEGEDRDLGLSNDAGEETFSLSLCLSLSLSLSLHPSLSLSLSFFLSASLSLPLLSYKKLSLSTHKLELFFVDPTLT